MSHYNHNNEDNNNIASDDDQFKAETHMIPTTTVMQGNISSLPALYSAPGLPMLFSHPAGGQVNTTNPNGTFSPLNNTTISQNAALQPEAARPRTRMQFSTRRSTTSNNTPTQQLAFNQPFTPAPLQQYAHLPTLYPQYSLQPMITRPGQVTTVPAQPLPTPIDPASQVPLNPPQNSHSPQQPTNHSDHDKDEDEEEEDEDDEEEEEPPRIYEDDEDEESEEPVIRRRGRPPKKAVPAPRTTRSTRSTAVKYIDDSEDSPESPEDEESSDDSDYGSSSRRRGRKGSTRQATSNRRATRATRSSKFIADDTSDETTDEYTDEVSDEGYDGVRTRSSRTRSTTQDGLYENSNAIETRRTRSSMRLRSRDHTEAGNHENVGYSQERPSLNENSDSNNHGGEDFHQPHYSQEQATSGYIDHDDIFSASTESSSSDDSDFYGSPKKKTKRGGRGVSQGGSGYRGRGRPPKGSTPSASTNSSNFNQNNRPDIDDDDLEEPNWEDKQYFLRKLIPGQYQQFFNIPPSTVHFLAEATENVLENAANNLKQHNLGKKIRKNKSNDASDPFGIHSKNDDSSDTTSESETMNDPILVTSGVNPHKLADIDPDNINATDQQNELCKQGWAAIGGHADHIKTLHEMIILPLLYPEVFTKFNISPPRGVLFGGPPGTGKTLTARTLANIVQNISGKKVSFFVRKGADCLSKWVGEAERQLRLLFEQAKAMQPSIIFFDEIDGLAPIRNSNQDHVHSSIVSTLLALMDGLDGRGDQVIVIGATNRVDSIDPALRRPGRFDRELTFSLPNQPEREQILKIHTQTWLNTANETTALQSKQYLYDILSEVSHLTAGYSGADLQSLCTQASMCCMRRTLPHLYTTMDTSQPFIDRNDITKMSKDDVGNQNTRFITMHQPLNNINITKFDFIQAMKMMTPTSQRMMSKPSKYLNNTLHLLYNTAYTMLPLVTQNLHSSVITINTDTHFEHCSCCKLCLPPPDITDYTVPSPRPTQSLTFTPQNNDTLYNQLRRQANQILPLPSLPSSESHGNIQGKLMLINSQNLGQTQLTQSLLTEYDEIPVYTLSLDALFTLQHSYGTSTFNETILTLFHNIKKEHFSSQHCKYNTCIIYWPQMHLWYQYSFLQELVPLILLLLNDLNTIIQSQSNYTGISQNTLNNDPFDTNNNASHLKLPIIVNNNNDMLTALHPGDVLSNQNTIDRITAQQVHHKTSISSMLTATLDPQQQDKHISGNNYLLLCDAEWDYIDVPYEIKSIFVSTSSAMNMSCVIDLSHSVFYNLLLYPKTYFPKWYTDEGDSDEDGNTENKAILDQDMLIEQFIDKIALKTKKQQNRQKKIKFFSKINMFDASSGESTDEEESNQMTMTGSKKAEMKRRANAQQSKLTAYASLFDDSDTDNNNKNLNPDNNLQPSDDEHDLLAHDFGVFSKCPNLVLKTGKRCKIHHPIITQNNHNTAKIGENSKKEQYLIQPDTINIDNKISLVIQSSLTQLLTVYTHKIHEEQQTIAKDYLKKYKSDALLFSKTAMITDESTQSHHVVKKQLKNNDLNSNILVSLDSTTETSNTLSSNNTMSDDMSTIITTQGDIKNSQADENMNNSDSDDEFILGNDKERVYYKMNEQRYREIVLLHLRLFLRNIHSHLLQQFPEFVLPIHLPDQFIDPIGYHREQRQIIAQEHGTIVSNRVRPKTIKNEFDPALYSNNNNAIDDEIEIKIGSGVQKNPISGENRSEDHTQGLNPVNRMLDQDNTDLHPENQIQPIENLTSLANFYTAKELSHYDQLQRYILQTYQPLSAQGIHHQHTFTTTPINTSIDTFLTQSQQQNVIRYGGKMFTLLDILTKINLSYYLSVKEFLSDIDFIVQQCLYRFSLLTELGRDMISKVYQLQDVALTLTMGIDTHVALACEVIATDIRARLLMIEDKGKNFKKRLVSNSISSKRYNHPPKRQTTITDKNGILSYFFKYPSLLCIYDLEKYAGEYVDRRSKQLIHKYHAKKLKIKDNSTNTEQIQVLVDNTQDIVPTVKRKLQHNQSCDDDDSINDSTAQSMNQQHQRIQVYSKYFEEIELLTQHLLYFNHIMNIPALINLHNNITSLIYSPLSWSPKQQHQHYNISTEIIFSRGPTVQSTNCNQIKTDIDDTFDFTTILDYVVKEMNIHDTTSNVGNNMTLINQSFEGILKNIIKVLKKCIQYCMKYDEIHYNSIYTHKMIQGVQMFKDTNNKSTNPKQIDHIKCYEFDRTHVLIYNAQKQ